MFDLSKKWSLKLRYVLNKHSGGLIMSAMTVYSHCMIGVWCCILLFVIWLNFLVKY